MKYIRAWYQMEFAIGILMLMAICIAMAVWGV